MRRILIVEDDLFLQKMLQSALRAGGFEYLPCSNGAEALESVRRDRPDLVLLDVHLPDMDGHEICRRLKRDPRARRIPVIMLTGEALSLDSRLRGLALGAEDYLFKPVSPKVIIARIRSILEVFGRVPV